MHAAEWAVQGIIVTILLAWVGKLHLDVGKSNDKADTVARDSMTREEFDRKFREYKDEIWQQRKASQNDLVRGINRQFDTVMGALARLEARMDSVTSNKKD